MNKCKLCNHREHEGSICTENDDKKDYCRCEGETRAPKNTLTGYKIACMSCGKQVSTTVPKSTIIRAIITCPECYIKETERYLNG